MPDPMNTQHASLSRPRMVPVDLPKKAVINRSMTVWQDIVYTLVQNPDQWFELTRKYTALSTATALARKTIEANYPADVASRLESASMPAGGNLVTCYLRLVSAPVDETEEIEEEEA